MPQTLIHSPDRTTAVIAHWENTPNGLRLIRLTKKTGPVPDHQHLLGAGRFTDLDALKRAVLAAMAGPVGDTLDRVLLTQAAYQRWMETARAAVATLKTPLDGNAIPDERASALPDGRLRIWVDMPNGQTIKLDLAPHEWAWRDGPPH